MFIDTANTNEIKEMLSYNLFEGVTTNPKLLLKEGKPRFQQLSAILELEPSVLFVQLVGDTKEELLDDYHAVKQALKSDNTTIAYKVPLFQPGYRAIAEMRLESPNECILGTSVYSVRQGFMGCLTDCDYIAPYVNRMRQLDIDPYKVISDIHDYYQRADNTIKIMGASFNSAKQVMDAFKAGVDNATINFSIFQQLMTNAAADEAIQVFNEQGRKLDKETR